MNLRHTLELGFVIIIIGNILMHAQAFSSAVTAVSASYNGMVKSLQGM